jgi:hypothetical protein
LIGTPHQVVVQVLIDTGAEVDLIRPGLIPKSMFRPASKRLVLRAANGMVLRGGSHTVELDLACKGYRVHDGEPQLLEFPTVLFEANIESDILLSFKWCRQFELDIRCGQYGLQFTSRGIHYFLPGSPEEEDEGEFESYKRQIQGVSSQASSSNSQGTGTD